MVAAQNGVRVTPGKPKAAAKKFFPPMPEPEVDVEADDFLAFWQGFQAEDKRETKVILGVTVVVPNDLPLSFEDVQERMAASKADSDSDEGKVLLGEMLAVMFGEDVYEQWRTRHLTGRQLRLLTTWGMLNANGKPTTFEEAGAIMREHEETEAAEGKPSGPQNRADRRAKPASSKTIASANTGQRSKPTSRANTASRRTS